MSQPARRLPVGAEAQSDGSTHFRVWAPRASGLRVVVERAGQSALETPLDADGEGYHAASVDGVGHADRYRFRIGGKLLADPASRFQPEGPFGPSEVVDPSRFEWQDAGWKGVSLPGQVLYEIHIGTFTPEGTWRAAMEHLGDLATTGITVIELMPLAEFPGRFGWGYDGVFPFAPTRLYGTPDDARTFVDAAHRRGLSVILDVVYNHFGPSGSVHREFSASYFSTEYENEWGDPLNFDGPESAAVREYFIANAGYWIDEFHLDGLRLDAVQSIHDRSGDHIVAAVARRARSAARGKKVIVVAEHEAQRVEYLRRCPEQGGIDAMWNDDFHHSAVVALTGRREAYYSDYHGTPQELISATKHGYLFQGQRYAWQKRGRGTPTRGLGPSRFVTFLENHDQVANSGDGLRLHQHSSPALYRAVTAFWLLMPGTPMLFQGQEFGASTPFLYFADHENELAEAVRRGRAEFVSQFPSMATPDAQRALANPHDEQTFVRCKLHWEERRTHTAQLRLHEHLLALRREEAAFHQQASGGVDGAVLDAGAFVLRYFMPEEDDDRLVIVNLGRDLTAGSLAEPLVAPPAGCAWRMRWSTESSEYGGIGAADVFTSDGWRIPGHSCTVLAPRTV